MLRHERARQRAVCSTPNRETSIGTLRLRSKGSIGKPAHSGAGCRSHGTKRDIPLDIGARPSYSSPALPGETYRVLLRMPEELRRALAATAARSRQPQRRAGSQSRAESLYVALQVTADAAAAVTSNSTR